MLLTPGPSSPGTPGPALAEHRIERGKPRPGMPPAGASSCSARRDRSEKLTLHLNSPPNDLIVFRNI